jgi:PiT family inorganic phosphate transporter
MATLFNIVGAFSGTAVAVTIGTGIVDASVINLLTIAAAMVAIVSWSTAAARYGLPTSESHALVAGLAGAGLATAGPGVLLWSGWEKVFIGLFLSTVLGFLGGGLIVIAIYRIFRRWHPGAVRKLFSKLQILSAAFMAFGHGSNDGQKFIGVFALALVLGGILPHFSIPFEVILLCAVMMGLGTSLGGYRIIRKMGMQMVKLEVYQGFAAEAGAASVIQIASIFGIPLSTTHTIGTSIMGVGSVKRLSAVDWGVSRQIILAWILTFPVCGAISWGVTTIALRIF